MNYFVDTESILNSVNLLAQAYGDSSYGTDVYAGDEQTTPTPTPTPTTPLIPGIPNTGIFTEQPILLVPVILGAAVIIAAVVLIIKQTVRKIKG